MKKYSKIRKFLFVLMCLLSCLGNSLKANEDLPKFRMIDIGLFSMDGSQAFAINEKGQVAGSCKIDQFYYIFLWDEVKGLKIIDNPSNGCAFSLKMNNNGQIATLSYTDPIWQLFLWDPYMGFSELETSKNMELIAFNDKGQILGQLSDQIYLWDHKKKINLTSLFKEQVPGNWSSFTASSLNNLGNVALSAYKSQSQGNDSWGHRSFLWQDGAFKMIMAEKNWDTSVRDVVLDDAGNMIVNTYPRKGGGFSQYFINSAGNLISCPQSTILQNGFPVARGCLPGKLKQNKAGQNYITKGIEIKKLIKEEFPYYNVPNTMEVMDQNSKGYIVGTISTIYPGFGHAFLAIPEKQNNKKSKSLKN